MPATNHCLALVNRDHCAVLFKWYCRGTVAASRKNGLNTATVEALYSCSTT